MKIEFDINCTGNVVTGDIIKFKEKVFTESKEYIGMRINITEIIKDSYGKNKHQHIFTLKFIGSQGINPLITGKQILRKGRNIYRMWTFRQSWKNESKRDNKIKEKNIRSPKKLLTKKDPLEETFKELDI